MQYQYRCPSCRHMFTTTSNTDIPPCPVCKHQPTIRKYSFSVAKSFPAHFNTATGTYVNNEREFRDALKVSSEEASYRMNQEVNYQPLFPADMAEASSHGVTEEGLYETHRVHHDEAL